MLEQYNVRLGIYIGGDWLNGEGREVCDVINPATGAALDALPLATAADLDFALEAANRGFLARRSTAPDARAAILHKTAVLIRERADRIARIATLEQGKLLAEAKSEALEAAALLEFHAGEAMRIYGRVLSRPSGS